MRKYLYVCLVLLLGAIVAGCGGGKARPASSSVSETGLSKTYAEFRLGEPTFPSSLLWADDTYYQPAELESLMSQNLVEFESDGKVKPGPLTSSMEQPNLTTYVYKLKSGVKFSDGVPVTVADAVYSLKLNLGPKSEVATFWSDVASVSAQGNSTVIVKLKRPKFEWQEVMGMTSQVLEKAAAEKGGGEKTLGTPSNLPIGSGPWKFTSYAPEQSVVLEPNTYWTGQQRPTRKIVFTEFKQEAEIALALRSGAIDASEWFVSPKLFENIPGVRRITAPGVGESFIVMDTDAAPLNDVHVRRAIAYATNVSGIVKSQYGKGLTSEVVALEPTNQLYLGLGSKSEVNQMLASLPTYKYNLAAAKRELARSSSCAHGCSTTVQVQSSGGEAAEGEILVNELNKIGIKAKLKEMSAAEASAVYGTTKSQIEVGELTNPYPSPDVIAEYNLLSSGIALHINGARFSDKEVDAALEKLSETDNPHARLQLVGKVMRAANEEEPYVPMYSHVEWMELSDKYVYPTYSQWTANFTPWALDVRLAK